MFKFFYLDIPASVTLTPDSGKGTLNKRAIDKFRDFNGGELPRFRVEQIA